MLPEIPFDVSYTMPEGLRAEPNDPGGMDAAVSWLESQADQAETDARRSRLLGLAGGYAGMLRQLGRARQLLDAAISLADRCGERRQGGILRIRLADVVALEGDPASASDRLRALLDACAADPVRLDLVDVVHQHLGKALLEAGQHESAIRHLERALDLRERKDHPELLASTRAALSTARRAAPLGTSRPGTPGGGG